MTPRPRAALVSCSLLVVPLLAVAACSGPDAQEPTNVPTASATTQAAGQSEDLERWRETADERADEISSSLAEIDADLGSGRVAATLPDVCLDILQGRDQTTIEQTQRTRIEGFTDGDPSAEAVQATIDLAQQVVCPRAGFNTPTPSDAVTS